MSEELDGSLEITGTDDMGGFSLPPEGNIEKGTGVHMVFNGEIKECGNDEKGRQFELVYVDDSNAKARLYCDSTSQAGLSKLVGIGSDSGAFDKIDKKRIAGGKKPIQSPEGNVVVKVLTGPKFLNQLRKEINGCSVLCSINISPAKPYKDKKSGETKEGYPQANITKIAPLKSKAHMGNSEGTAGQVPEQAEDSEPAGDDDFD